MVKFRYMLASFLTALAGFQGIGAMAQTMDFSCPASGTTYKTNLGHTTTVRGQSGMSCKVERSDGVSAEIYALLHPITPERKTDPAWTKYINPIKAEMLWPLAVGKRHEASVVLGSNTFNLSYVVTSFEPFDAPMGRFDVFVVELKETGSNGYSSNVKWWVSPKHKFYLKTEGQDSNGRRSELRIVEMSTQ